MPGAGLFHLLVLYVVWGTTFLAIRIALHHGIGPLWLGSIRLSIAGVALLLIAALGGRSLRLARGDASKLAVASLLLWVGGNGFVLWAETRVESSYAALVLAATPIWAGVLEAIVERCMPHPRLVGWWLVGLSAIALLSGSELVNVELRASGTPLGTLALVVASLCWSAGMIVQRRRPIDLAPSVSAAYQMIFAGVIFSALALLFREPMAEPDTQAWRAIAYLIVFGSIIAYTCFAAALRELPSAVVMTHAYVNPVVAVVLGWLVLDERLTAVTAAGAVLVLVSVAGVFRHGTSSGSS